MESMHLDSPGVASIAPADLHRQGWQPGHTPMETIHFVMQGVLRTVHLKLEGANPTGSMKDRTGYALIQHLAEQDLLHAHTVIVESTSGNLGVALASLSSMYNYQFVAVVDPKTTTENIRRLRVLGAQIDMVHEPDVNGGYLLSRLAHIKELCQQHPQYIWTNQYSNPANPRIHYSSTAPEIYQQMQGQIDAVFVPVSTGGTLAGIGRYFRAVSPATQIIGVDAYGSVVFGATPAPRKLTGIGSSRSSSFLTEDLYNAHLLVTDEEAFAFCRALCATTGFKVGGSSGAVLAACAHYLQDHPAAEQIVCICADNGENYASSIFSDAWLEQQGLHLSSIHLGAVQDIVRAHTSIY